MTARASEYPCEEVREADVTTTNKVQAPCQCVNRGRSGPFLLEFGEAHAHKRDHGIREKDPLMKARIYVTLKPGVLDPQGKAILGALEGLGFAGVEDVRQGKYIELELADGTPPAAIDDMCRKLLANTVIENFRVEL